MLHTGPADSTWPMIEKKSDYLPNSQLLSLMGGYLFTIYFFHKEEYGFPQQGILHAVVNATLPILPKF